MATHENINQALNAVQEQLKAPKNQKNSFGKYNYRSAEDILEAVKPLLFANGLTMTISDKMVNLGDRFYVEATVSLFYGKEFIHVSASARESEDKKGMDSAQITGAASSYARKYALNGMFAIDDTKDADSMDNSSSKPSYVKMPKSDNPSPSKGLETATKGLSATPKQVGMLFGLAKEQGFTERDEAVEWLENQAMKSLDAMTTADANKLISTLMEAK